MATGSFRHVDQVYVNAFSDFQSWRAKFLQSFFRMWSNYDLEAKFARPNIVFNICAHGRPGKQVFDVFQVYLVDICPGLS